MPKSRLLALNSKTLSSVFVEAVNSKSTPPPGTSNPASVKSSCIFDRRLFLKGATSPTASQVLVADSLTTASAFCNNLRQQLRDSSKSGNSESANSNLKKSVEDVCNLPLFKTGSSTQSSFKKDKTRSRKGRWIFNNTSKYHFKELIRLCANKLGTESVIPVFGSLRRETGLKEYNALIGICVEKAAKSSSNTDEICIREIDSAFKLLHSMVEQGFQLEEETYGMLLRFFIEKHMKEEFQLLAGTVKSENPASLPRLAYYEMLLWDRVDDREKIQELFDQISLQNDTNKFDILENYLLAACEGDMQKEILQLLDIIDITRVSSIDYIAQIFKSLGRLLFQRIAEKLILALKTSGHEERNVSNLISEYVTSIPNLPVEDLILNFNKFHEKVEISPHYSSNEKLISYCCDLRKVHTAISLINMMSYSASKLSTWTLNSVLHACEEECEFHLVHSLYEMILHFDMKANSETFSILIDMNARAKNFDDAYVILHSLKNFNLEPTPSMYNAIMAGYFRERRTRDALNVVKEMKNENLNPDSQTYSYLIANCTCINDITKYYNEMVNLGVQLTKHVSMALINAYTSCGHFEEAKQVVKEAPGQNLNELRNVLMSALACNGRTPEALSLYKEIKLSSCSVDPKSILALIDNCINSDTDMVTLLELLGRLEGSNYWGDGCCNVVMCCVQRGDLSGAVDLFRRLKDATSDEVAREGLFDEAFSRVAEAETVDVGLGMGLLRAVKEDIGHRPSRKCLDFLLAACVRAEDVNNSLLIWKEYADAGLPYNAMTYTRMYQALLAGGAHKRATRLLGKIPKDDPHVFLLLNSFREKYTGSSRPINVAARSRPRTKEA